MRRWSYLAGSLVFLALTGACQHYTPAGARVVGESPDAKAVTEAEVQQEVQRFAGRFIGHVGQASDQVVATEWTPKHDRFLRRVLTYESSVLDIAAGPIPMVNLLDMVVFMTLSRSTFEDHWLPTEFGEPARPLANALNVSTEEIWQVAKRVLTPQQQTALRDLIEAWRRENPSATHVEAVRLSEFSERAGESARNKEARGLLASVTSAAHTADEAVLLGERAMFLALRVPFLMRLQARLTAREIVSDSIERARVLEPMLEHAKRLEPMIRDLTALTANTQIASAETRRLIESIQPILSTLEPLLAARDGGDRDKTTGLEETLDTANQVTERALPLVRELRELVDKGDRVSLQQLNGEVDQIVRRWLFYLFLVGAGWTLMFSVSYVVIKRLVARRAQSKSQGVEAGP